MGSEDQQNSTQLPHHPPSPYASLGVPFNLGLQKLTYLDQVTVQKATTFGNKYLVNSKDGEILFYVKENASILEVELGGQNRCFRIDLYDEREHPAISLRREVKRFGMKKMQVFMGEELVSQVRLKRPFLGRLVHINDANDHTTLTASGPVALAGLRKYKFKLFTESKQRIGSIAKLWRGLGNELFSEAEEYQIRFPVDLHLRYKAAVIGTCILIDIHYYTAYIRGWIM